MNTNGIAKFYSALAPDERLSLLLSAAARGDQVERERLANTAPMVDGRVPHTFFRAMAFREVMERHRMEQLELAALYFRSLQIASETFGKLEAQTITTSRLYGFLVRTYQAGWLLFCENTKLTAAALLPLLPGGEVLQQALDLARCAGFTDEEAEAYVRSTMPSPVRLKTAKSIGAELLELFEARLACWGEKP